MIQIGGLRVHLDNREISRDGKPVRIGSRAFDILELLIAGNGALVTKKQILDSVWPDSVVEENNLQVHMSALRKLLGNERELIKTVPGRGYRLVSTQSACEVNAAIAESFSVDVPNNLPAYSSALIGRDEAIADISAALQTARLLTLVGSGGIGKTRLSIEVARGLSRRFPDGIYLVSLASATDAQSVIDLFCKVLGVKASSGGASLAKIADVLGERRVLIVLDNCEHVLKAAAELVETILQHNGQTHILATSREALRLPQESQFIVATLQFPTQCSQSHEVLQCSAVKLFMVRARAVDPNFSSDAQSIALTGTVCRRLDGIPLAIELAAARAAVLGIQTLAAHLDDRFRMLTGGHRTALPRHQTLKATLDWSYALLDEDEKVILRRLGIFVNGFTLSGAIAVMGEDWLQQGRVIDALSGLAAKSLIVFDHDVCERRYWLLETTRAYALQKLDEHGEYRLAALHHVRYLSGLLDCTDTNCERASGEWPVALADKLDDIRAGLRWAFSPKGDNAISVEFAARAVYYFFDASLVDECCEWAQRGLAALIANPRTSSSLVHQRMRLLAAYAAGLVYINGPDKRTRDIWSEVLSTAITLGNREYEARALWGLWNAAQYCGAIREATGFAQRFHALAADLGHATNTILGERLIGISKHYAGYQTEAFTHLSEMLTRYDRAQHRLAMLGSSIDHRVVTQATMARILWLQGERDTALALSEQALSSARSEGHDMAACYVLVESAIPLALLSGKRERAKVATSLLSVIASRAGLTIWQVSARCYDAYLSAESDGSPARLREFFEALHELEKIGLMAHAGMLYGGYAMALAKAGCIAEGLQVVERALAHCDEVGEHWYCGELRRLQGELLLMEQEFGNAKGDAQACFNAAMEEALLQGSRSFQLRAATSIASLWQASDRARDIADFLMPVCSQMSEGLDFDDYDAATSLLSQASSIERHRDESNCESV